MEGEESDHFHSVVREDFSEEMTFTVRKSGIGCFAFTFFFLVFKKLYLMKHS